MIFLTNINVHTETVVNCVPAVQLFGINRNQFVLHMCFRYQALKCLPRDAMASGNISADTKHRAVPRPVSGRPCLCPSVRSRSSTKTAKRRIEKKPSHDSHRH